MTEPIFRKVMVVSTHHIPQLEVPYAEHNCRYENDYGWQFSVSGDEVPQVLGFDNEPTFTKAPNLLALMQVAQKNGCDLLELDADGPTLPLFPIYFWNEDDDEVLKKVEKLREEAKRSNK